MVREDAVGRAMMEDTPLVRHLGGTAALPCDFLNVYPTPVLKSRRILRKLELPPTHDNEAQRASFSSYLGQQRFPAEHASRTHCHMVGWVSETTQQTALTLSISRVVLMARLFYLFCGRGSVTPHGQRQDGLIV
jgi:hypothetical protein